MGFKDDVNGFLKQMRDVGGTSKGEYGEGAVFAICEELYQNRGGILIHSYEYKTDSELPGNVKRNDNGLYIENLSGFTELDVLYVSPYNIFPIEVKAYKAKEITLTDDKIDGCFKTDKSPIHQNEMHCRHLYSYLYRALPNGETKYVKPIVCFVDKCSVIDDRSDWQREYIYVAILNTLKELILSLDTPNEYKLNLSLVDNILKEGMIGSKRYLPPRF